MPAEVKSLIKYRNSESEEAQALIASGLDNVRWDLLSDAARGPKVWAAMARKMGPQALRMNLNTLLRSVVFHVASSLRDEEAGAVRLGDAPMVIGLDTSGSMSSAVTGNRGAVQLRRCDASTWKHYSPQRPCDATRTAL